MTADEIVEALTEIGQRQRKISDRIAAISAERKALEREDAEVQALYDDGKAALRLLRSQGQPSYACIKGEFSFHRENWIRVS